MRNFDALSGSRSERRPGIDQLSAQAYARIRDMIASGAFPPSTPLREVDLVRMLKMSRTPVREALHRLHTEGLIHPSPGGGYTAIELGAKEMTGIYQVREVLTGLAARLAAMNRTRVDIARLEDALDAMEIAYAGKNNAALDNLVREFYSILCDAARNEHLQMMLGRLVDLFRYRALAVTHPGWHEKALKANRAIVAAIVKQDADAAEKLARAHMVEALAARIEDLQRPPAAVVEVDFRAPVDPGQNAKKKPLASKPGAGRADRE